MPDHHGDPAASRPSRDERLSVLRRGEDGPLAVFIHGFPLDARMWADQLERLADIRRCIAVDLRGFGRSAPGLSPVVTMDDHADDVAAVIASADAGAADVVALSMGGYVALALAERHPDLVRSLALLDTRAVADTPQAREGRNAAIEKLMSEGRSAFVRAMVPNLVAPGAATDVIARTFTMGEDIPYETLVAALAGMRERPDRTPVLVSLEIPVAVIVGEHDGVTPPSEAAAMADLAADATIDVIAGAGHLSPMEAPDAVADALRRHLIRLGTPEA